MLGSCSRLMMKGRGFDQAYPKRSSQINRNEIRSAIRKYRAALVQTIHMLFIFNKNEEKV